MDCECGCGMELLPDKKGRIHRFVFGHQYNAKEGCRDLVLQVVEDHGPVVPSEIERLIEYRYAPGTISTALCRLKDDGKIHNVRRMGWAAVGVEIPVSPSASEERIVCACGCGKTRLKYDDYGREGKYIFGHQARSTIWQDREAVLKAIRETPGLTTSEVGKRALRTLDRSHEAARRRALVVLRALADDSLVMRWGKGTSGDPYRWRAI